jgi:hypothetical protein
MCAGGILQTIVIVCPSKGNFMSNAFVWLSRPPVPDGAFQALARTESHLNTKSARRVRSVARTGRIPFVGIKDRFGSNQEIVLI